MITVWFTGISGSGKTTIADAVVLKLPQCYRLDGDDLRTGLNSDLGFSYKDRKENIRRAGEVAKLFSYHGIVLASFISPYAEHRKYVRDIHESSNIKFIEVFVDCPLKVAEDRDPKGLYNKVRSNRINNFTAIDDPYETPISPDIHLRTDRITVKEAVQEVIDAIL